MTNNLTKILKCCHHDPFSYLGVHFSGTALDLVTFRSFQPSAATVNLIAPNISLPMKKVHSDGLFEVVSPTEIFADKTLNPFSYQYEIQYKDGNCWLTNDPYRFSVQMDEQDIFLYSSGRNYRIYDHLGAHRTAINNIEGTLFRVWAPNAQATSIIGNFNGWDPRTHQMRSLGNSGIWELFVPHLQENEIYKFSILTREDKRIEKSDPFQFYGEIRPKTGSVVKSINGFCWTDQPWQQDKIAQNPYESPLSIYEVHPGSWRKDLDEPERFLTYRELADSLVPYVKKLGFTHIELLPVMEHPLDESWGYQVTAPYSLSSRYGTPEDFMYFVDFCHHHSIGVILDWVPAHFPTDDHSLGRFDGTALYEHEDYRRGYHPDWGTFIYNYGRQEVSNYLIANALFWLEKYHIDGLRVDAVASMLYLDYSRNADEWLPNRLGGRENLEAIEFIRHLNSQVYDYFPQVLLIAEESTSFYGVSLPADHGGLGFGFKWNMGWMNDQLNYFTKDPLYRKFHHNKLTFSIMYAFSENFLLPLSHDEVVHGKKSLLEKMPGDLWQKFANLRLLLLSMWMHPGKKLLFMGGEFGQFNEWNCKTSLDWHLLEQPLHRQLQDYVGQLNELYSSQISLFQLDFSPEGFSWLDLEDNSNSIVSFARYGKNRQDHLVAVFNYTPQVIDNYKIALPQNRKYRQIFSSDETFFGGSGTISQQSFTTVDEPYALGQCHTIATIPPLAGIILQPV